MTNTNKHTKKRSAKKIILRTLTVLIAAAALFTLATYLIHRSKSAKELEALRENGYYNPVSVGDYSLNVAMFGKEDGAHRIVCLAGLGSGEFSVTMRQTTAALEKDNQVVFPDRAGYGLSDDTENDMTLEYIVEDYRRALKNAGVKAPYVLMPHSIGGAYATYWVSKYPDEIEAVVFIDGSQLSETAFEEEKPHDVGIGDKALAFAARLGFSRYALRHYLYLLPDNYSDDEQYLADALTYLTLDSTATVSESGNIAKNAQDAFNGIIANDVPKLYICSSWGIQTKEDLIEYSIWVNRQLEKNKLPEEPKKTEYDDETVKKILDDFEKTRHNILYPYTKKMGSCRLVCLGGDHMIYEQKPKECYDLIAEFLDELDK